MAGMPRHLTFDEARDLVRCREQLLRSGITERGLAAAVRAGDQRRLQRNRYVDEETWRDLWPESRHLLEVCAAVAEMRDGGGAASYDSAGVLHGLPLFRHTPSAVHVTTPEGKRMSSRAGLRRHGERLGEDDVVVIDGVRCTTLDRTVFDLVRTLAPEAAVAVADAGLRRSAMVDDGYDADLAAQWRRRMLERCARSSGARGIRQAERVIRFAEGESESPGESVSRLQLARLGFRRMRLQVEVPGPDGKVFRVDIELEDEKTFFEFDGAGKYLELASAQGKTVEQVVLDEKRREDWIRGTTQRRMVRVEAAHIVTSASLAARLASFGVAPLAG